MDSAADDPGDAASSPALTQVEADVRLARDGANEVPDAPTHALLRLVRKFWGLSAWMLELIAGLSLFLDKRVDFTIALGLLGVNAAISYVQEQRASTAVSALRRRLQITARVCRDGLWTARPARDLVQGDWIRVRAGDVTPADMRVLDGRVTVDQSAFTGESREVQRRPGDGLYAGSVVREGEATGVVTATGLRTYFGRTAQLVQTASPRLHVEEVTGRLVRWLFLIVGTLVAATVVLAVGRGMPLLEILPLSLVLLMSAVPVALPAMFTVSTAVGSVELGRRGVLITRLAAVEDAANMTVLCADKTGTLTANRPSLDSVLAEPGWTDDDVMRVAALASQEANQDPIDLACLAAARTRHLVDSSARQVDFAPFSAANRRTEAVVDVRGRRLRAVKGALRTVASLSGLDPATVARLEVRATEETERGFRTIAVAQAPEGDPLRLVGLALLRDAPRPDSRALIDRLRSMGVRIVMLTGDAVPIARQIGQDLGLDGIASAADFRGRETQLAGQAREAMTRVDGVAEVLPEDKFAIVKALQAAGHVVGMTGDGVNDAPALRQAEIGIAVSGATDVAKSAASIVLTSEGLTSIVDMVRVGRSIYQRVLTWIVNKVSRTILKAGFVVGAFLATEQFVISALGMVLLVFMTDFAKVSLSVDRVHPSQAPETWKIQRLVGVAIGLGIVMLVEALALLALAWQRWNLNVRPGELQMFSFLTLLFFALFSIVSIRERRAFWCSRPGWVLAAALAADASIGAVVSVIGLGDLRPLRWWQTATIVAYAGLWSLGPNDWIKTRLIARWWKPSPQA